MIKNDHRTREFKMEIKKYGFAHIYDCCDRAPRGKILKNRVKYPKQDLSEELEETLQNA